MGNVCGRIKSKYQEIREVRLDRSNYLVCRMCNKLVVHKPGDKSHALSLCGVDCLIKFQAPTAGMLIRPRPILELT